MSDIPKIYVFINSGKGTDWVVGCAIAEDGTGLGSHVSSNEFWFRHDMGLTSDWKHEIYDKHYPDGYALVEVEDVAKHKGLDAAYQLNQQKAAVAKEPT
jgi:hypothetical protein